MKVSIVVPCFNEEAVLPETIRRLTLLLDTLSANGIISADSAVVFVDDGSRDATWRLIESTAAQDRRIGGIKLSHNRGHQNALLAGVLHADGDAVITVDADLQDDLGAIEQMLAAYRNGAEIVFGVRRRRDTDTFFKRFSAESYYHLLRWIGIDIVFNHADYRLLGRASIEALRQYREVNMFLRGIVPQLGFRTATVLYDRAERFAGDTKYPLSKMLVLAFEGVTSFSSAPLRMITGIGILVSLITFCVGLWALYTRLFTDAGVPGWASTVVPIYFLGGLQLFCMGIMGEYVSKIYGEAKQRPRFIIERTVGAASFIPGLVNQSRAEASLPAAGSVRGQPSSAAASANAEVIGAEPDEPVCRINS